jgi:HAD superfamily hydrolase (TIGR01490 family)
MRRPEQRRGAALFDMDGTLIDGDSDWLYLRWERQRGEVSAIEMLRVLSWLFQHSLGVLDAERVAQRALRMLSGASEARLVQRRVDCHHALVRARISEAARAAVEAHKRAGDLVAIVTAATPYAARPVADDLGIPHIVTTELEVADGKLTGQAVGPLCYGEGKLVKARAVAERLGFDLEETTFYSDSWSDLPLLRSVGRPVAVNPDPRLRRVAEKSRWSIQRWRCSMS